MTLRPGARISLRMRRGSAYRFLGVAGGVRPVMLPGPLSASIASSGLLPLRRWNGLRMIAAQELAATGGRAERAVGPYDLAARHCRHWPAAHAHAFVGRVVNVVVQEVVGDQDLAIGVPDGEVRVSADRDRAFPG